uniref:Coiled-coil protein 142 C-terminal domain-containing protein n=1 Tax=Cyclopterus lumpus TaxID=8103 RepID=A0A8C2WSB5_CYCLU
SISSSLQRAESLLRSTFNPSLKWLFHCRSHDEEEVEGHFVVAHNLVSRSSARLLRLQQALLTKQCPNLSFKPSSSLPPYQVCVKGIPVDGVILLLPSSSSVLQGHYTALWRLLEQRSLLLFIHEYTRRARLAAAYVSRVSHLLEEQLEKSHRTPQQVRLNDRKAQELRVHLNHWSCLFSKVHSDHYLRPALVQHPRLLVEIKQTLDLLVLQALVLMGHYVYAILCAIAQTQLDSVPREVLEDILAGTDLYNQAVGEQRAQHSTTQLRTAVLQQAHYSTPDWSLPNSKGRHPAAFTVKELMMILAVHQADMAAKQLHCWASEQSCPICQVHTNPEAYACPDSSVRLVARPRSGTSALRSELTWEQLTPLDPQTAATYGIDPISGSQDMRRTDRLLRTRSQALKLHLDVRTLHRASYPCSVLTESFCCMCLSLTHSVSSEVCRSLGSALRDKCLKAVNQSSSSGMMSVTMEHLLLLCPPLLSSLSYQLTLQRQTVSLVLATVQLSMVWVMSKAYQFLSSWRLNNFLLITQGDLKSLMMDSDSNQLSTLHNHNQLLLRKQLEALDRAVSELQTFSSLVLKTFSSNCKRMSGEIFEQTMPSARHWRPSLRTGFPSSPSQYASLAVQTVIGQVLEGVAPLSDDARIQALSITMTAFMEAWMEHILKQRIKFSVQGALQLKQDFDSIRELIQSDKYGLSAELHQRLLSLRVFQQVDSAVVCLLQQPQAKPDLQSRAWEPFKRCPANSSRDSLDAAVGNRITNLRCMEAEDLTQADASVVTADVPPLNPSTLGVAQREWLDLRIQSSTRRWRLSGLQCLSKSEP